MHDIWNPWHGCRKVSEGCQNCYMYFLDAQRGKDGGDIYRTKAGFRYPLSKDRSGQYKVKSGEMLRVCMLTKRPERVEKCLPRGWGDGWDNVMLNVTAENQRRADERVPILLSLPFRHKGVMCAPFLGTVTLKDALATGQIEQVLCDGENYGGSRPCHYEWVKALREECAEADVTFVFCGTGRRFVKDGKLYKIEESAVQSQQAFKSGLSYAGKPMRFHLTDSWGMPIPEALLYRPKFREKCAQCGMKPACNGCSSCGKCEEKRT